MAQNFKDSGIYLLLLFGVLLQLILINVETKDSPENAAINFTKAYYQMDKSMACWLCKEDKTSGGINVVDNYIDKKTREAAERGFGLYYLTNKVYSIKTHIIEKTDNAATINVAGSIKPPLKSFFTKEHYKEFEQEIHVQKINGKWKVCGNPFGILNA